MDDGFVRLEAVAATDISVVNAARVSFGRRKDELDDADKGLIRFLLRERHGTPFEHNFFSFHVRAPIFVAREWFRHRAGWSYNEFSGRYAEIPEAGWIPTGEQVRSQVGKPGSYSFAPVAPNVSIEASSTIAEAYSRSWGTYRYLLGLGVAKEVARSVLPVGAFTEFYASCNARSLMHFCGLRNAPSAQAEIRWYASELETHLRIAMPETYEAFVEFGRIAP